MDEGFKFLKTKVCWKNLKGAASLSWWCQPSTSYDQKKIRRCHSLYHSDIATLSTVHGLTTWENIYAVGKNNPTTSVSCKAERKWDLTGVTIWFTLTLVGDKTAKIVIVKEIYPARTTLQDIPLKADRRKESELKTREEVAHAVGVGAVKLRLEDRLPQRLWLRPRSSMVSFEGETGPYVQYAYARIQSILRKANHHLQMRHTAWAIKAGKSSSFSKTSLVLSNVIKKLWSILIAKYAINLAIPSTNTMHTLVSWMKAQNAIARLL